MSRISRSLPRKATPPARPCTNFSLTFNQLKERPHIGFPALAASFGYDLRQFVGGDGQPPPQAQRLDPRLQQLQGRLDQIERANQQAQEAQTNHAISTWAKGKQYFEAVRKDMAALIQAGVSGFTKDGAVDLDAAYTLACQMRNLVEPTAQEAAAVKRARAAAVSVRGGLPGAGQGGVRGKQPAKGRSVRDSIYDAINEARNA